MQAAALTPEFTVRYRRRSAVERVIANLTRYCGARRARARGLQNVDFQMKSAATAYNLRTWLRATLRAEAAAKKT